MTGDLFARAQEWAAEDPDDQTRSELEALLVDNDPHAIANAKRREFPCGLLERAPARRRGHLGVHASHINE